MRDDAAGNSRHPGGSTAHEASAAEKMSAGEAGPDTHLHAPAAPPSTPARQLFLGIVVALLAAAVVLAVLGRIDGFTDLKDRLADADEAWLLVCFVAQLAVFVGYAIAYRAAVAFEGGPLVPYPLSLRVVVTTFTATQVVTAGGAAGVALTYWTMHRVGFRTRDGIVRAIGLNTLVYLVFGVVATIGALVCLVLAEAPLGMTLPWLVAFPLILLLARWFTQPARVQWWVAEDGGRLRRSLGVGISAAWFVRRFVASRTAARNGLLGAGLYWAADVVSLGGGLLVFGIHLGPGQLMLAYTTGYLAQLIPIPFLGTGGVDAATAACLSLLGVPINAALLGVLAHRLFAFWLPIIPGLVLTATLPATGRALDTVARVDPEAARG